MSSPPSATTEADIVGALSPSRAADFKNCPLLYRFRVIDRIPETPSSDAVRGTVVHSVLENLFDRPAPERTLATAEELLAPVWDELAASSPDIAALFDGEPDRFEAWMESARNLLANYFRLEDPRRIEPDSREELVEFVVDGLRLRGYVDRIDVAPSGEIRIVDYKTGAAPREAFEAKALFQMKFYALVLWRTRGAVPRQLKLMYLADADALTYTPEAGELDRFERTLQAIWSAIRTASESHDFRPSPSRLCDWCDHHARCPAQGGTLPPYPEVADEYGDRRVGSQTARDGAGPAQL